VIKRPSTTAAITNHDAQVSVATKRQHAGKRHAAKNDETAIDDDQAVT